jgi:hypothetical protein
MDKAEALILDHTQRDQPNLTIVGTIIKAGEHLTLEDQRGVSEVDTVLAKDPPSLLLVPLEFHSGRSSVQLKCTFVGR